MKYNKEEIGVKKYLTQAEYQRLVLAIANIQLVFDDEDENVITAYHPEYATTVMPSIVAHIMLTGVEFEEGEDNIYDSELVEKILADDFLREFIFDGIIYGIKSLDFGYPHYFTSACDEAEKIVQYRIEASKPVNIALNKMNSVIAELASLFNTLSADELQALAESYVKANQEK